MIRLNKVFFSFQMITQKDHSLYHKNTSFWKTIRYYRKIYLKIYLILSLHFNI